MSNHHSTNEGEAALEERISSLENSLSKTKKRASMVALVAALLGTGGAAGLIQLWTGLRLANVEAALKATDLKYRDRDQKLREAQIEQDIALKKVEVDEKKLAEDEKRFNMRIQQHKAETELLEKVVTSLRKAGDLQHLRPFLDALWNSRQSLLVLVKETGQQLRDPQWSQSQ